MGMGKFSYLEIKYRNVVARIIFSRNEKRGHICLVFNLRGKFVIIHH